MKHIITLLLVLLFASCEQMETKQESVEDDPNVFVFDAKFNPQVPDTNISYFYETNCTFTISDEDNCTYYIFEEEYNLNGYEDSFSKLPCLTEFNLIDKVGNTIFTFNPITKKPFTEGNKKTHKGKIPKYYDKSTNLTRSKLERTKDTSAYVEYRLK